MTSLPPDNSIQPPRSPADRRDDDRRDAARAPRNGGDDGPIGFGAVMRTVDKQRTGANPKSAQDGVKAHAKGVAPNSKGAAATAKGSTHRGMHADASSHGSGGTHAAHAATHGATTGSGAAGQTKTHRPGERSDGSRAAGSAADRHATEHRHDAGSDADSSAAAGDARWVAAVAGNATAGSIDGSDGSAATMAPAAADAAAARAAAAADAAGAGGRITPARAMELVEDVARSMNREQGVREIHIRLEPEHLGPLAVKLTVDQRGIRARIATRTDGAAAVLATGTAALRERLLRLGYPSAEVEVAHDDAAFEGVAAI